MTGRCPWCGRPCRTGRPTCGDRSCRARHTVHTRHAALLEDLDWMLDTGETVPTAIRRLGCHPRTLIRAARTAGRDDLLPLLPWTLP